jgi:hypothetical protein
MEILDGEDLQSSFFYSWMQEVCSILNENKVAHLDEQERLSEEWTAASLLRIRGDEPEDSFDDEDSPFAYADFLIAEYSLYGPEGE